MEEREKGQDERTKAGNQQTALETGTYDFSSTEPVILTCGREKKKIMSDSDDAEFRKVCE